MRREHHLQPPLHLTPSRALAPITMLYLAAACTPATPSAEGSADTTDATESASETSTSTGTDPDMMPDAPACTEYDDLDVAYDIDTSLPRVVRGADLQFTAEDCAQAEFEEAGDLEAAALAVIAALRPLYGLSPAHDFEVRAVELDALGYTHVRVRHVYDGVVVSGSELLVHFDASEQAYELNGHLHAVTDVDVSATLSAAEAEAVALQEFAQVHPGAPGVASSSRLAVRAHHADTRLAFELDVSANELLRRSYAVDAHDGSLLMARDAAMTGLENEPGAPAMITGERMPGEGGAQVEITGWRVDLGGDHHLFNAELDMSTHEAASCSSLTIACINQPTDTWGASDGVALSAFANVHDSVDYFRTIHARPLTKATRMVVRFPNDCNGFVSPNAFFVPGYANGDLLIATLPGLGIGDLTTTDILGHEYSHAVVSGSADLVYESESGALNESFADIFGVEIEFATQTDNTASYPAVTPGTADWLLGEDTGVVFRDLRDPSTRGQPTRYGGTSWVDPNPPEFTSANDYGGVHRNSGVQNQFFYFLSVGGSGNNDGIDYDLVGIGRADAARLAYRALTVYAGPNSDYADIRQAWRSAAMDLDMQLLAAVEAAWEAVGVGACPTWFPDADADGFGDADGGVEACEEPPDHVDVGGDCDDANPDVFPGAEEICSDGVINDCALVFCEVDPDVPGCVSVEDYCGTTNIAPVMGLIEVSWSSDCRLQTSEDLQNWTDYEGEVTTNGCDRAASFDPLDELFFRLRTP